MKPIVLSPTQSQPISSPNVFINKSENEKSCYPQQVVFHKADYSKAAVYKCKPVDYSKAVVYKL